ncbi:hypothetical protein [Haloarchaeobius sp. DFWS5]|uniref:hypothetical protein n=1 Tax=Haloarchaeobius sp. DFWS5 TaxID=3446114 RepID=UPI003EBCC752
MCSSEIAVFAFTGLFWGPPMARWPYKLAKWDEFFDAIGRKSSGSVEPADWKVSLTRWAGIFGTVAGVGFLVFCLLL